MEIKRRILFFSLVFIAYQITIAQNDSTNNHIHWHKNQLSLSASYSNGYVMPTNVFVRGSNLNSVIIDDFQSFNLKLKSQTTGEYAMEQIYNYPAWGIGLSAVDFFNYAEIGIPIALYGFIELPLLHLNRLSLNAELGFGMSFNWRSFNPLTNSYNVAIGAGQTFMSDAGLNLNYELDKHFDLILGANFSHFSNGAIKLPNYGINSIAPKMGVRYNIHEKPKMIKKTLPKFKSQNEWSISTFYAIKNIIFDSVDIEIKEKYEGIFFPVFGLSGLYNRKISPFSKIGIGMTFNFNESINAQVQVDNNELADIDGPFYEKLQLSIYPSYEFCIDKVSVLLQPAFYLYRKHSKNESTTFHQRINIKYQITDNIFAGITLRDFSMHADFVEWTLGYKFDTKQNN